MRIGINLLDLTPGKIGGMEQYIRNLIWYTTNEINNYKIYLFLNVDNESSFDLNNDNIKKIIIDKEKKHIEMYTYIEVLKLDIWFCPLLVLEPQFVKISTVITIPDIQHEFFPEFFDENTLSWRKKNFAFSAKKASAILTISDFSKNTIVEKYNLVPEKVSRIYLDADKEFYCDYDINKDHQVKQSHNLPDDYIFYPANTWPHKNHINLLRALKVYKKKYDSNIKLVLTGTENSSHLTIRNYIEDNKLSDNVQFLGYVKQEHMPYIYRNASCLVFPSMFEGFGIPLVEAMRTNCPIICSNSGSIPEVLGDCGLVFDPNNPDEIAEKIHLILIDKELKNEMIEKGRKRAEIFCWEKSAQETLSIFDNLVKEKKNPVNYPLVSIITPSYNQGEFITETINSVLSQNYPYLEYIVVDGGSTDNTVDILKSYGEKIKWVSEQDDGQAHAVNKGIAMAKGEIIGWLNSDDTYLPETVKKAVDFMLFHKEVGMVYGEGYHVDIQGEIIDRYPTETFNYARLAEICFICQPTAFFRKSVLEDVGMLDKELHLCMDYELWMKIGEKYQIAYMPQFLATSRMYKDNKTLSRRKEVYQEIIRTVKNYYNYVPVSWIYGYVDYLMKGKRNILFIIRCFVLFVIYNKENIPYALQVTKDLLKKKFKQRYGPEIFTDRYDDKWVSKIYKFNLINKDLGKNKLVIKGRHIWPYEDTLKVTVSINGFSVAKEIGEKGEFEIIVNIKEAKELLNVQIISNRTFCPKKLGINNDIRELAYIVDDIKVE